MEGQKHFESGGSQCRAQETEATEDCRRSARVGAGRIDQIVERLMRSSVRLEKLLMSS